MGRCRVCGGYASEGKSMCPWDQIRHGEFKNGKWVVIPPFPIKDQPPPPGTQGEMKLEDENG